MLKGILLNIHAPMSAKIKAFAVLAGLTILISLFSVGAALETVDEGHTKVVKDKGAATGETFEPGWHVRTPIVESTVTIPTRPQTYTMSGSSFAADSDETDKDDSIRIMSKDGQEIHVDVTVRYRIPEDKAVRFHKEYNNIEKAEDDLIRPTVRSVMRDEASAMSAQAIITKDGRATLTAAANAALREDFDGAGMQLEAVQVRNMHLNPEYERSLEKVEIAENEREAKLIKAEADAEAEVKRAEGDREAYQIRAEALKNNPEVLTEAYIKSLDESDTVYVPINGENGLPTYLDVKSENETNSSSGD